MSDPLPREIRCVLVPVGNLRLLLPNATIAEVITHTRPEPVPDAPEWLLGRIAWRGWRVPLVSFTTLTGAEEGDAELSVRVAVLKALGGNSELPFIAFITQGFPRLTTLNSELIIPTHDGSPLPAGVRAQVLVRDDVAVIPDLEWIETSLLGLFEKIDRAATAGDESSAAEESAESSEFFGSSASTDAVEPVDLPDSEADAIGEWPGWSGTAD